MVDVRTAANDSRLHQPPKHTCGRCVNDCDAIPGLHTCSTWDSPQPAEGSAPCASAYCVARVNLALPVVTSHAPMYTYLSLSQDLASATPQSLCSNTYNAEPETPSSFRAPTDSTDCIIGGHKKMHAFGATGLRAWRARTTTDQQT